MPPLAGTLLARTRHTREIERCEWNQLVLDQRATSLLKDDFESFYDRESWSREKRLPFLAFTACPWRPPSTAALGSGYPENPTAQRSFQQQLQAAILQTLSAILSGDGLDEETRRVAVIVVVALFCGSRQM
jgi:hypothetical protein